jgi:hypothetical protein
VHSTAGAPGPGYNCQLKKSRGAFRVPLRNPVPFLVLCLFSGACCAGVEVIDSQASYPEGPLWDQGRLLYVEYAANNIKSWDGRQVKVFWHRDKCGNNALIHFRGDHISGGLLRRQ